MTDLLRDKLHHLSSQLADAKERTKELEEGERGRLDDLLGVLKGPVVAGQRGLSELLDLPFPRNRIVLMVTI